MTLYDKLRYLQCNDFLADLFELLKYFLDILIDMDWIFDAVLLLVCPFHTHLYPWHCPK